MTIYEVNLNIQDNIYNDYYKWLTHHIGLMMKQKGFIGYHMAMNSEQSGDSKNITVWYYLDSMDSLNDYLENHSKEMRDDGIKKFGDKFSANRRIFETEQSFANNLYMK